MKELIEIQKELKAPKSQFNSFGKYHYRSAEDILEAVKPLLFKNNVIMAITDTLENIGDRFYVKATVTLKNSNNEYISASAYAREEAEKKGMDGAQITGTASSYARKYALNGLFLIDDTKDSDTDEYQKAGGKKENAPAQSKKEMTAEQVAQMKKMFSENVFTAEEQNNFRRQLANGSEDANSFIQRVASEYRKRIDAQKSTEEARCFR